MPDKLTDETRDKMLREIHVALVGNKEYKVKGLVDTVHEHEEYVKKDKRQKVFLGGVLIGLTLWKDNIVGFISKHIV